MNTFTRIRPTWSIVLFSLIGLFYIGCKKGPQGPQGEQGPPGTTLNGALGIDGFSASGPAVECGGGLNFTAPASGTNIYTAQLLVTLTTEVMSFCTAGSGNLPIASSSSTAVWCSNAQPAVLVSPPIPANLQLDCTSSTPLSGQSVASGLNAVGYIQCIDVNTGGSSIYTLSTSTGTWSCKIAST